MRLIAIQGIRGNQ